MSNILNEILLRSDTEEVSAEIMSELLMDDGISTWKTFENLVYEYVNNKGSRIGIDYALEILTGRNLEQIAQIVINRTNRRGIYD